MLHAILIDDESNGLKSLELLINKFIKDVKIVGSTVNPLEGIKLINDYCPDIVFLDINMPNLNGFDLLGKLEHRHFHLIFTTAHREYALKAIKQQAIDYLLKPIGEDDLKKTVSKVNQKIAEAQKPKDVAELLRSLQDPKNIKISVPGKNGIELINQQDILYFEASSNRCIVCLANGKSILVSRSLKEYEEQLCKTELPFIRIHNSFIINLNYAARYKEEGGIVVMSDGKNISISKNKKDEFLKRINFTAGI